jgi:hypothetical protein
VTPWSTDLLAPSIPFSKPGTRPNFRRALGLWSKPGITKHLDRGRRDDNNIDNVDNTGDHRCSLSVTLGIPRHTDALRCCQSRQSHGAVLWLTSAPEPCGDFGERSTTPCRIDKRRLENRQQREIKPSGCHHASPPCLTASFGPTPGLTLSCIPVSARRSPRHRELTPAEYHLPAIRELAHHANAVGRRPCPWPVRPPC